MMHSVKAKVDVVALTVHAELGLLSRPSPTQHHIVPLILFDLFFFCLFGCGIGTLTRWVWLLGVFLLLGHAYFYFMMVYATVVYYLFIALNKKQVYKK